MPYRVRPTGCRIAELGSRAHGPMQQSSPGPARRPPAPAPPNHLLAACSPALGLIRARSSCTASGVLIPTLSAMRPVVVPVRCQLPSAGYASSRAATHTCLPGVLSPRPSRCSLLLCHAQNVRFQKRVRACTRPGRRLLLSLGIREEKGLRASVLPVLSVRAQRAEAVQMVKEGSSPSGPRGKGRAPTRTRPPLVGPLLGRAVWRARQPR